MCIASVVVLLQLSHEHGLQFMHDLEDFSFMYYVECTDKKSFAYAASEPPPPQDASLAHSGRVLQQQVGCFSYEGECGKFLNLTLVYRCLEAEVELLKSAPEGQVCQVCW